MSKVQLSTGLEQWIKNQIQKDMGFSIIKELGRGGAGVVYHCQRESFGIFHDSAIKAIPVYMEECSGGFQEGMLRRILTEIEVLLKIGSSPHLLALEDYQIQSFSENMVVLLIRMELAKPFSISEALKKTREERLRILLDLGEGLRECEKNHILHGDIKPENLFWGKDGQIKIGDFGIAGLKDSWEGFWSTMGTLAYCTPELWERGERLESMDRYSLGLIGYQLFHDGALPFQENDTDEKEDSEIPRWVRRRFSGELFPKTKKGGPELDKILRRLLEKPPEARYESGTVLCSEIENLISGRRVNQEIERVTGSAGRENLQTKVGQDFWERTSLGEKVGNLWNGGFVCFHEDRFYLSDLVRGKVFFMEPSGKVEEVFGGYAFSLTSHEGRLLGLNEEGELIEVLTKNEGKHEQFRIKRTNGSGFKFLYEIDGSLWGDGDGGRQLLGRAVEQRTAEQRPPRDIQGSLRREDEGNFHVLNELEGLMQLQKRCFHPIPSGEMLYHAGTLESSGLFLSERNGRGTKKMLDYYIKAMNTIKEKLIIVDMEGNVIFFDRNSPGESLANKQTDIINGYDIERVCCTNGRIFLESESGKLFLYEEEAMIEIN